LFKAIARADLVVIPAQASEPDIREALVIAGDVRDVEDTAGRRIPYRLLLTKMYPLRTRVTRFRLCRTGAPGPAHVQDRARRAHRLSRDVPERCSRRRRSSRDKGAGAEIDALLDEIEAICHARYRPTRHSLCRPRARCHVTTSSKPFMSIADDVDDGALEAIARKKGVPALTQGAGHGSPRPVDPYGQGTAVRRPHTRTHCHSSLPAIPSRAGNRRRARRMSYVKACLPDYALAELEGSRACARTASPSTTSCSKPSPSAVSPSRSEDYD
jgi:hypothetical protein